MSEDRLIDGEEAGNITGIKSRSRRYALIAQGKFPLPVKVGSSTLFSANECHAFVAARIAERDYVSAKLKQSIKVTQEDGEYIARVDTDLGEHLVPRRLPSSWSRPTSWPCRRRCVPCARPCNPSQRQAYTQSSF